MHFLNRNILTNHNTMGRLLYSLISDDCWGNTIWLLFKSGRFGRRSRKPQIGHWAWQLISGWSRGGSGNSLEPPLPLVFKKPIKMKWFGLSETKLFHFHWIFRKIEMKSAKRTTHIYIYKTPFQKPWIRPSSNLLHTVKCFIIAESAFDDLKSRHMCVVQFWRFLSYVTFEVIFFSNRSYF